MRPIAKTTILLAIQAASIAAAAAQPGDTRSRSLQLAARSQLGILEFCRSQGMVEAAAVAAQQRLVAATGPLGQPEQEAGRAGFLAFDGNQGTFAQSASAQGLTLKSACESRAAVAMAIR